MGVWKVSEGRPNVQHVAVSCAKLNYCHGHIHDQARPHMMIMERSSLDRRFDANTGLIVADVKQVHVSDVPAEMYCLT